MIRGLGLRDPGSNPGGPITLYKMVRETRQNNGPLTNRIVAELALAPEEFSDFYQLLSRAQVPTGVMRRTAASPVARDEGSPTIPVAIAIKGPSYLVEEGKTGLYEVLNAQYEGITWQ